MSIEVKQKDITVGKTVKFALVNKDRVNELLLKMNVRPIEQMYIGDNGTIYIVPKEEHDIFIFKEVDSNG